MEQIGKYRLEEEIGRGGFGRVYRAFDPTVGRRVAIKVLLAEGDQDLLTRFRNEANATGKLHHKNIVTIHDYGEFQGTPYLVMEYLEGEDLQRTIAAQRPLSVLEKITIMTQVAEGLHHAHLKGIVHRDVKPANMMLLADYTVKVMDFGIARLVRERATRLTQTGNLIGTISHMAPEQFHGADVDQLCDIFAYGLVYYELLTGKHPFKGNDPATTIYAITSRDPEPISRAAPDCPAALEQIVLRALHKDRDIRYQSLEDLLFDVAPIRLQLQSDAAKSLVKEAERSFNDSQIDEARRIVREVLQLDPNNTAARRLRESIQRVAQMQVARERSSHLIAAGRQELAARNYAKAISSFEGALKLDTDSTEAALLLEDARAAAQRAERAASLLAQARLEFDSQDLTNAYRDVAECLQLSPDNTEASTLLGAIRKEIEKRERERRVNESIARIEGLTAAASFDEAISRLADLEAAYPGSPQIKPLMASIHHAKSEYERRHRLTQGISAARQLISERRWAEAVMMLEPLEQQFPTAQDLAALLAYAREELRVQEKADTIERLIEEARGLIDRLEFERADGIIAGGLRDYPGEPSLEELRYRAGTARREHERTLAIQRAGNRAEELLRNERFDEAIAELDRAISTLDAAELLELRNRAEVDRQAHERKKGRSNAVSAAREFLKQNRPEQAAEAARAGLSEYPGEPALTSLLSEAETRLLEREKAEGIASALRQALEAAGKSEFDVALRILEDSVRKHGPDSSLVALKSQVEAERDQQRRAAAIETALAEAAKHSSAGRDHAAITTLERAAEAYPGEPAIEDSLTKLRNECKRKAAVNQLVGEAAEHLKRKDYPSAVEAVLQGLQLYPEEPSLRELLDKAQKEKAAFDRQRALQVARERVGRLRGEGRLREAAQALEQALRKLPDEVELEKSLAEVRSEIERQEVAAALSESKSLVDTGRLDDAVEKLGQYKVRFPEASEFRTLFSYVNELIKARDRADEIDQAVRDAQKLLEQKLPDQAASLLAVVVAKYSEEERLATLLQKAHREVTDRNRRDAVQQIVREAEGFLQKQRYADALRVLDKGLEQFPSERVLEETKAAVCSHQKRSEIAQILEDVRLRAAKKQFGDALKLLDRGLERFPGEPELVTAAEAIRAESAEHGRQIVVAKALRKAETALSKNQPERALEVLVAALAELPGEPDLLRMRELAEGHLHRLELARKRSDQLEQLRRLAIEARKAPDPAKLDEIWATASTLLISHENDAEFQEVHRNLRLAIDARASALRPPPSAEFEARGIGSPAPQPVLDPVRQNARSKRRMAYAGAGIGLAAMIAGGVFIATRDKSSPPPVAESIPPAAPRLAKIVQFYASQPVIKPGEAVQLCYDVINARSVRLDPAVTRIEALSNHCFELKPASTADYKLIAVGEDGTEIYETVRIVVQDSAIAMGTLVVQTQLDGVAVLIDGRKHGRLTEKGEVRIPLDAKEYLIGVERAGFESPEPRRVRLGKDATQRIQFRLQAKPSLLAITGVPAGVQVTLDGKPLGILQGDALFQVPPGAHVIEFAKDRQPFKRLSLQFEPGSRVNLNRQDIGAPEIPKPIPPEPAPDPRVIEARQWEQIRNGVDPAVFEQFVRTYPNGQYSAAARRRIEQLEWDTVRTGRNSAALQAFANKYITGTYRDEALKLIEQIEWERVNRSDADSVRTYLKRFPNSQQAQAELSRLEQMQRERAESQAVVQVLSRFAQAYESKDAAEVARLWPTIPKPTMDTIRKVFSEARSITMRIQPTDLRVGNDAAVVKAQRTSVTVYDRRREARDNTDSVTIQLRRSGSGWVIQSID